MKSFMEKNEATLIAQKSPILKMIKKEDAEREKTKAKIEKEKRKLVKMKRSEKVSGKNSRKDNSDELEEYQPEGVGKPYARQKQVVKNRIRKNIQQRLVTFIFNEQIRLEKMQKEDLNEMKTIEFWGRVKVIKQYASIVSVIGEDISVTEFASLLWWHTLDTLDALEQMRKPSVSNISVDWQVKTEIRGMIYELSVIKGKMCKLVESENVDMNVLNQKPQRSLVDAVKQKIGDVLDGSV